MEEYIRQKKERRRREKEEKRQKRTAQDSVATIIPKELVLTTLERKRSPVKTAKKSTLESIQEYGWVANSKKFTAIPSSQHSQSELSTFNSSVSISRPRRSIQFLPSPESAVSDLSYSQNTPTKSSPLAKKNLQSTLLFRSVDFDSDEDLLDFADKQWRKGAPAATSTNHIYSKPTTSSKDFSCEKKVVTRFDCSVASDESDDDLVSLSESIERSHRLNRSPKIPIKSSHRIKERSFQSAVKKGKDGVNSAIKKRNHISSKPTTSSKDFSYDKKLVARFDCSAASDDSDDDLVSLSESIERSRRLNRSPQNPIKSPQRIKERSFQSAAEEGKDGVNSTIKKRIVAEAGLWTDSEEESHPVSRASTRTRTKLPATKRKSNPSKSAPEKERMSPTLVGCTTRRNAFIVNTDVGEAELKPEFENPKLGPPSELVPLTLVHSKGEHLVPASINRYLKDYQRAGIRFIHRRIVEGQGCILGDDMGLGKTVQVIAMLAAMLGKYGMGEDLHRLNERRRNLNAKIETWKTEQNLALSNGTLTSIPLFSAEWPENLPVLVIVPSSVTQNWMNEFDTWGHFGVALYHGGDRALALERIRIGLDEIMVCSKGVLVSSDDLECLKAVPWKLIVVDEQHQQKNRKSAGFRGLATLRDVCHCPVLGMTGTIMQNNPEELWACVDTVAPGFLDTWEDFKALFATPIMMARSKTATEDIVRRGNVVVQKLTERLKVLYIKRYKSQVLADDLPMKDERVLFCEPSPIQKRLYEHILMLPDFILLKYAQAPCECGVNRAIFQQFKQLRGDKEKLDFQRRKRDEIQKRSQCCWKMPLNPDYDPSTCSPDEISDPMAPLWKWQHIQKMGECCALCPFCLLFPALNKLLKLSSHPSLLQLDKHPDSYQPQSAAWLAAMKDYEFAKVAIPEDVLRQLPGGDYIRQDGIMDQHQMLSGKMKVLAKLLKEFSRRNSRVLLFSYSTQMLDLVQNFVRSEGYSFLRLDGTTPNRSRQALVDQYQDNGNIFIFLISTKAGGLGLNLTAANVVIIFDVEFNPSNDEQAQDRAFRIGQQRDVLVIRLVTRGTIEELKYIRQIYKVQLKQDTIGDVEEGENKKAARMFRAVQGDKERKGELFGIENLLRYKDGRFMDDLWKSSSAGKCKPRMKASAFEKGLGLVSTEEVAHGLHGLNEDKIEDLGRKPDEWIEAPVGRKTLLADSEDEEVARMLVTGTVSHADFLQKEKGHAALEQGDDGFEEEQGGYSQVVNDVMELADVDAHHDTMHRGLNHPSPVFSSSFQPDNEVSKPEPATTSKVHVLPNGKRTCTSLAARPSRSKRQTVEEPTTLRSINVLPNAREAHHDHNTRNSADLIVPTKPTNVGSLRNSFAAAPKTKSSVGTTTFSAADLFLPSYVTKKKKSKKLNQ